LQDALSQRAREEVFAIARKALSDLAWRQFRSTHGRYFCAAFKRIKDEEKASLESAFADSDQPLIVHTAV